MLVLDPIRNFNNVIEYYNEILTLTNKLFIGMSPHSFTKSCSFLKDPNHSLTSIQAIIFNKSLKIQTLEELIVDNEMNDSTINNIFSKIDSFANIKTSQPMSEKEKCKQIRNCLAHAMFEIRIKDEKRLNNIEDTENISLYINNGKVFGEISFNDFYDLEHSYQKLYGDIFPDTKLDIGSFSYDISKLTQDNINEDIKIKKFINSFNIKGNPLNSSKKNLLIKLIKHIGLNNFIGLGHIHRQHLLTDFLTYPLDKNEITSGKLSAKNDPGTQFMDTLRHLTFLDDDSTAPGTPFSKNFLIENEVKLACYKKPLIYASSAIGLANYCMSYIREINQNGMNPIFEYKNIDLTNIKPNITSSDNCITLVDPKQEILQQLNQVENKKTKILQDISKIQNTIENLSNPKNKNPKKDTILKNTEISLQQKSNELVELEKKLVILNENFKNCTEEPYENSYHFFRHLRNSLAHGQYSIDFKKFFNTRKLEDISFTFYDNIYSNNNDSFSVSMKISELLKLVYSLQQQINISIEESNIGNDTQKRFLEEALLRRNIGLSELTLDLREMEEKENSNDSEQASK